VLHFLTVTEQTLHHYGATVDEVTGWVLFDTASFAAGGIRQACS
jgi:hypothetical protein